MSDAAPQNPAPQGGAPKPTQSLSPLAAVICYFAVPGFMLVAFLLAWRYPPLWMVDVLAFGLPLSGLAVVAVFRVRGKPLRPVVGMAVAAWGFSALYTVMRLGEVSTLDWGMLLLAASAVGVVTAWRAIRWLAPRPMDSNQKVLLVFGAGVFAAAYVYGVAALVNIHADLAPPQCFTARIVAKSSDGGRHPNWYLTVAPWGTERKAARHSVWPEVYDALDKGEIACVDLHRGLLGLRWVEIAPCAPFERLQGGS